MRNAFLLLLLCGSFLVGCASPDSRTYSISVRNETARPVTLVLTKTGGPVEDQWASPEEIANSQSSLQGQHGIAAIRPGGTATVDNLAGRFPGNTQAMLRVYMGEPTFGEMLGIFPGFRRADVPLQPGKNDLVVRTTPNGLAVTPRN